jgi:cell division protein FtsI (penicillin-binding protein 3)
MPPTFLPRSREEAMQLATRVLKPKTSDAIRKLMRMNVVKGTGKRANAEGYRVGGKTGTAEKVVNGHYARSALLNSFLSTFPTDDPQYVVLVTLDEPQRVAATNNTHTAGSNAAPTVGRIIARIGPILGVPPRLDEAIDRFDAKVSATY